MNRDGGRVTSSSCETENRRKRFQKLGCRERQAGSGFKAVAEATGPSSCFIFCCSPWPAGDWVAGPRRVKGLLGTKESPVRVLWHQLPACCVGLVSRLLAWGSRVGMAESGQAFRGHGRLG